MSRQYTDLEMKQKYGPPNQTGTYLVSVDLPFRLILAWDLEHSVSFIRCHKLEAENVKNIFTDIRDCYTESEIDDLHINRFGGCFNFRAMRKGNRWSRHSWGTAIDLDPERNQLHESKKTARFARPEYQPMIDIFEKYGWVSLGRLYDYDWMHFEAGKP